MQKIQTYLNKSSLNPRDILSNGTFVGVDGKYGTIIKYEQHKDQFGQPIIVHVVKYFAKFCTLLCNFPFVCTHDSINLLAIIPTFESKSIVES